MKKLYFCTRGKKYKQDRNYTRPKIELKLAIDQFINLYKNHIADKNTSTKPLLIIIKY